MADDKETGLGGGGAIPPTRRGSRISSRVPPVIEGRAEEIASTAPNPPPETQVAADAPGVSLEAADAPLGDEVPHVPPPDGPVRDIPMPVEPGSVAANQSDPKPAELKSAGSESAVSGATGASKARGSVPPSGRAEAPVVPERPRRRGRGGLVAVLLLLVLAAGTAALLYTPQGNEALGTLRQYAGLDDAPAPLPPPRPASLPVVASPSSPSASSTRPPATVSVPARSPSDSAPPSRADAPPSPAATTAASPPTSSGALAGRPLEPATTASGTGRPDAAVSAPLSPSALPPSSASTAPVRSPEPPPAPAIVQRIEPPLPSPSAAPPPAPVVTAVAPPAPSADPRVGEKLADMERRVADLDGKLSALSSAPPRQAAETTTALAAQGARLARLDDALGAQRSQLAQFGSTLGTQGTQLSRIDETLSAIDRRLSGLETKLATPKADVRAAQAPDVATRDTDNAAARLLVSQGVLVAVQAGRPFTTQIAALRALGAEDGGLARLVSSADRGVPTAAALRESFNAARPRKRAAASADPDARWDQRMLGRLTSLVSVQPVSEKAGAAPEAVATRIDAALGRDDLAGALTLYRELPAADQAALKPWAEGVERRVAAEADARALMASALALLAKPKS